MLLALVYATPGQLSAGSSFLLAYGVGVVGGVTALVLAASRLYHHLSLRAQDGAAERASPVLQGGPAVLSGVVDLDDPGVPAVRIRIEEQGREWHDKNGWHHEWRETGRTVEANPFHLVLGHGERLRVEPDERVFLIDALATAQRAGMQRTREAALTQGERVTIAGRLATGRYRDHGGGSAYRDGGATLSLQAPRGQQMLISAGSLAARHAVWIRFYAATVALLAVALVSLHLGLADYHRLRLTGQRVSLPVVQHDTYTTTYKGRVVTHYRIAGLYAAAATSGMGQVPARVRVVDEVNAETYASLSGAHAEAPFIVVPSAPDIHQIGYAPTIHTAAGYMVLVSAALAAFLFGVLRRSQVPWYEQEQVVERGAGKLDP
jgi:hypothetical protein